MSFTLDMQKFTKKTTGNIELAIKSIVRDVAETIIEMSPVGDATAWKNPPPVGYTGGRFRGNWDYGFNAAPNTEYDIIDKSGSASRGRIDAKIIGKKMAGNVHFIANNLPYAQRLEDGWSNQAPAGMVSLTVIKWQSIVNESVSGIR